MDEEEGGRAEREPMSKCRETLQNRGSRASDNEARAAKIFDPVPQIIPFSLHMGGSHYRGESKERATLKSEEEKG